MCADTGLTFIVLSCSVVRMADPHSSFGGSRFGSENVFVVQKTSFDLSNISPIEVVCYPANIPESW